MANYLLVYDTATSGGITTQLQSFIKNHKLVDQWSQPFAGLYLLKSSSDLLSVSLTFDEFFARQTLHVVCPISADWAGGILPAYIWQWLQQPDSSGINILGMLASSVDTAKK